MMEIIEENVPKMIGGEMTRCNRYRCTKCGREIVHRHNLKKCTCEYEGKTETNRIYACRWCKRLHIASLVSKNGGYRHISTYKYCPDTDCAKQAQREQWRINNARTWGKAKRKPRVKAKKRKPVFIKMPTVYEDALLQPHTKPAVSNKEYVRALRRSVLGASV